MSGGVSDSVSCHVVPDCIYAPFIGPSLTCYRPSPSRYNPALEEIVTAAQNNPESDGLTVCEPFDFGCIIETETLGTEAGEAYLKDPAVIASTEAATIESESDEPESEVDEPESEGDEAGDEPEGEDVSPTDAAGIDGETGDTTPPPPDAGSRGDPHCKSTRPSSKSIH